MGRIFGRLFNRPHEKETFQNPLGRISGHLFDQPHETEAFQISWGRKRKCPKNQPHEAEAFQISWGRKRKCPKNQPHEMKVFQISWGCLCFKRIKSFPQVDSAVLQRFGHFFLSHNVLEADDLGSLRRRIVKHVHKIQGT